MHRSHEVYSKETSLDPNWVAQMNVMAADRHLLALETARRGDHSGVSNNAMREKIRIIHLEQACIIADQIKTIPEGHDFKFEHHV